MSKDEEKLLGRKWLAGEKVDCLRFLYNTTVKAKLPDGSIEIGCIVGADIHGPEPTYTIEGGDHIGDFECPESSIIPE